MADSSLLQLPAEIRASIYRHVFSAAWVQYYYGPCISITRRPQVQCEFRPLGSYHGYAILLACRICYQEARSIFAASVRIVFDRGAQPSDLPPAIQQKYFPHTKNITLYRRTGEQPLNLTSFISLTILYVKDDIVFPFPGPQHTLQWLTHQTEDNRIRQFYQGVNDRQLNRHARDTLLGKDPWMKALIKDPARKFKIVVRFMTMTCAHGALGWRRVSQSLRRCSEPTNE